MMSVASYRWEITVIRIYESIFRSEITSFCEKWTVCVSLNHKFECLVRVSVYISQLRRLVAKVNVGISFRSLFLSLPKQSRSSWICLAGYMNVKLRWVRYAFSLWICRFARRYHFYAPNFDEWSVYFRNVILLRQWHRLVYNIIFHTCLIYFDCKW